MVRLKRGVAISVLKCAIIGFGATGQQAAFSTGMSALPKPANGVINTPDSGNVTSWALGAELLESNHDQLLPLILLQPDLAAAAPQVSGGFILLAQETKSASAPAESQDTVQEIKSTNAPVEPQAVRQEIKSAARLSSSKQRRRKPKMASVPTGLPTVAQEAGEPESQAVAQEAKDSESQAVVKEIKQPESRTVLQEDEEVDATVKPQAEVKKLKVQVAAASKKKYAMAPIKWGVRLTETLYWNRIAQKSHPKEGGGLTYRSGSLDNTQTADVSANTFIMQPYIAQVSGTAGVGSTKTTAAYSSVSGRYTQLYGGGGLRMFSNSRFPFMISYGVKNNAARFSGELLPNETTEMGVVSKSLALKQRYRPLRGSTAYGLGYSSDTSHNTENDAQRSRTLWDGDFTNNTPEHRVRATMLFNERETDSSNNASRRSDTFAVRDTYLPEDSMFAFQSYANFNRFADASSGFSTRYLLANTNATWQPEEESIPLFVDGNAHLFEQVMGSNEGASKSQSMGVSGNATYLFSTRSRGLASASVTSLNTDGVRTLSTQQLGSASYSSETAVLMEKYRRHWSANVGAANYTGQASNSKAFGGIGHIIDTYYPIIGSQWGLAASFQQTLGSEIDRSNGLSTTITNIGSLKLNKGSLLSANQVRGVAGGKGVASENVTTTAGLSVSDSRVYGKYPSHTQSTSLNFYLQGLSKGRYSYSGDGLTVNLGLGATYGTAGKGMALASTGGVGYSYTNQKLFNVRGLRYAARLSVQQGASSSMGDPSGLDVARNNTSNPKFPWDFNQRISYRIGQNEVSLGGRLGDQSGTKYASLWLLFRAWRTIGN